MILFRVPDMTCGACASRISRALQHAGLPPDVQVEIDVAHRQVRLTQGDRAPTADLVRQAIAAAGYTAEDGVPASTNASIARPGGCCCAAKRAGGVDEASRVTAQRQGCCG